MKKSQREIYAESFADYVIDALKRTGVKQAELARRAKVKPQTISKIVGKKPHSLTGKLLLPSRETVERIAKALDDPVSKARRAAGYSENDQVETVEQALDATLYWDQKGLGEAEKEMLRPILEMLDREAERLSKIPARKGPKKVVDIDEVPSQARKIKNQN